MPAFTTENYPPWVVEVGGSPMGRAPSLGPSLFGRKQEIMLAHARPDWKSVLPFMLGQTGQEVAIAKLLKEWGEPVVKDE